MGDSSYSGGGCSGKPRPGRVIVGGFLALAAAGAGLFGSGPQYQRALTTKPHPEEMTWASLAQRGLFANAHLRLRDVDVVIPPALRRAPTAERGRHSASRPAKVVPRGVAPHCVPPLVVIPPEPEAAFEAALAEIHETGTLTGRFDLEATQNAPAATTRAAGSWVRSGRGQPDQYVYRSLETVADQSSAGLWYWGTLAAAAVGLVICGSGAPSIVTCLFFTLPATLSVLGYGLRGRRASSTTRAVYAAAGGVLIYYGYGQLYSEGRLGIIGGDPLARGLGFLLIAVGVSACLGASASSLAKRFGRVVGSFSLRRNGEPAMSVQEAPAIEPMASNYNRRYTDPKFTVATDASLPPEIAEIAEALESVDFEPPLLVDVLDDDVVVPTTVQVGCRNMAMAVVRSDEGQLASWLVSILEDGFAVITRSTGRDVSAGEHRFGGSGVCETVDDGEPVAMLSLHLERTVELAEKRNTSVVSLESGEWRDVYLFANRVMAEIQLQHGESNRAVSNAEHGRFSFPNAPVAPLAVCPG